MFDAGKTRMIGLPYGEQNYDNSWAVFIQYRNVTDGQTNRQQGRSDGRYIGIYTPKISNRFVYVCDNNTCFEIAMSS